jgi:hypothetical protein
MLQSTPFAVLFILARNGTYCEINKMVNCVFLSQEVNTSVLQISLLICLLVFIPHKDVSLALVTFMDTTTLNPVPSFIEGCTYS